MVEEVKYKTVCDVEWETNPLMEKMIKPKAKQNKTKK